ncbi:AmmeMemoRadiSam system protein A [Romboutsia lituseburensis]|uniref:AmmeMemoRadiSam system protein A n=1 Tax=Romboutsia lituseburensis TaxID=1537 RepID=UPI00215A7BAD|nr:AmmeMemoRadiSam system protein A [Romboutsia lituseburensis]MCR8744803.1 AmmeMemoRadiSam system protein A [Romboutsia lituseburensis]
MDKFYLMPHPPIMIDAIGKGQEQQIIKTINSCKQISTEISCMDIDTIIIISPHGLVFKDGIAIVDSDKLEGDLSKFESGEIKLEMDINRELTSEIIENSTIKGIGIAPLDKYTCVNYGATLELDHGALIPLYYIIQNKKYNLVHITYGMLSKFELYKFGMIISESVQKLKSKAVLVASGDLSHRLKEEGPYSYSPYGKKFDTEFLGALESGNMKNLLDINYELIKEAGECGLRSMYILAGAMDGKDIDATILSYEDTFGVGYGVVKFNTKKSDKKLSVELETDQEHKRIEKLSKGDLYTQLARKSLYYYYDKGHYLKESDDLPHEMLNERRGVFVSLKKEGELKGCIGTIGAITDNVAQEIIRNAVSAATQDHRFSKVSKDELGYLDISVDVLFEPEPCTLNDLNVYEYGVIVSTLDKRGLLLPNLGGINSVDEQIKIALQKAGISYNEDFLIEMFKVERHKENNLED